MRFTDPTGRQVFIPNPNDPGAAAQVRNAFGQAKAVQVAQSYAYTPTRSDVATALDTVNVVATGVTVVTAVDAPPVAAVSAVVGEAAAIGAFVVEPTVARGANVLTFGAVGALKYAAKGAKQAENSVRALEQATQASTLMTAAMPTQQEASNLPTPPPPPPPEERIRE